jgi:hypothetical protein
MRRANLWNQSVSRVELDQRARDARLRLERLERLLLPRAAVTRSPLRRLLYLCSGVFASASRESWPRGPLSNRRPSCTPPFMTFGSKSAVRSVARQTLCSAVPPVEGCGAVQSLAVIAKPNGGQAWRKIRAISSAATP